MSGGFFLHDPGNELDSVDQLWAFVSVDDNGKEGIMGAMLNDQWFALVTAKESVAEQMRTVAEGISAISGKRCRLLRFARVEELAKFGKWE